MRVKKGTGILGGTFNPVHRGHIELGLKTMEFFSLSKVLYILSANPPHKSNDSVAPPEKRWEMLEMALRPFPNLIPCDIELKRDAFSYTIDTISELKKTYPEEKFFFISGSEGFLKIKTWKNYRELFKELTFLVACRNSIQEKEVKHLLDSEQIPYKNGKHINPLDKSVRIYSYSSPILYLSSTIIRNRVKKGQSIDNLVDNDVKNYIMEHGLYE